MILGVNIELLWSLMRARSKDEGQIDTSESRSEPGSAVYDFEEL